MARAVVASIVILACASDPASGQAVPRQDYLFQVPLTPPTLIAATDANDELDLFGQRLPGYRDVSPRDGIDDRRNERLLELALRFVPYYVQNTDNIPVNFEAFIQNRDTFPLWFDTWDIGGPDPELIRTRGVNFSVLGRAECDPGLLGRALDEHPMPTADPAIEDCKVLELMQRFTPGGGGVRGADDVFVRPRPNEFHVLFFDMPGEGEGTWDGVYEDEYERTSDDRKPSFPHTFAHPFAQTVVDDSGAAMGYELVLQYWVYYPTNDSGMNHEGDWEHVNVVVSPRSQVESELSAATMEAILDGSLAATDDAPDPLVVKRVDYYLHHLVMPLDYSSPNVYLPREEWETEVETQEETRFRESALWRDIRYMAYEDDEETRVNPRPLVYIGADNKGFNQALEMPGPGNRDPHASYPFPGRYPNVGPGGTTDQVPRRVDIRDHIRRVREGRADAGPTFEGGSVLDLASPERIRVIPDWERVMDIVRDDAQGRRDWGWMVLPIRWGYPATVSPFSGLLANVNLGNVAPIGPTYNDAWNVTGAAPGYGFHEPNVLPDILPIQLQDNFRNDLGFLNLTLPVFLNLPPLDFLSRLVIYPVRRLLGRHDTVYYPAESLPYRFVGISSGVSFQTLSDDFQSLSINQQQYEPFVLSIFNHIAPGDSTTTAVDARSFTNPSTSLFINVPFFRGRKFATENTVRYVESEFGADIDLSNLPTYSYRAEFQMWEYAGSIRYSPFDYWLQPYVKGGYGYAWYRLANSAADGVPLEPATIDWIGPRTLWPNVWHFGLGLELVPWRRSGADAGGFDVGFRVEYARYVQNLDIDLSTVPLNELGLLFPTLGDLPDEGVSRNDFVLALTVSF